MDSDSRLVCVFLQVNDLVCDDCVKFITDTQAEAKKNASFISTLIEQLESQCDLLGPAFSDVVRTPVLVMSTKIIIFLHYQ